MKRIRFQESNLSRKVIMVSLMERMRELHKQSVVMRSPLDKERVGREIESTDKSIDRLVYELYGLSEDEIRIVEG